MNTRKMITIVANLIAGFVVILVGLTMLPFYLGMVWGLLNAWLWIACPILLLNANKKEEYFCLDCGKVLTDEELRIHREYDSKYKGHSKPRVVKKSNGKTN